MVKVRIQLKSEALGKGAKVSPFSIIREMLGNGRGLMQFYRGLDAALMRQLTYTTPRMGIYRTLMHNYESKHGRVPIQYKSVFGITAGFLGSLCGNPADLILVRLQADKTLPKEK
jgi:solute carrier family 25 oxoglutarate transporter 11